MCRSIVKPHRPGAYAQPFFTVYSSPPDLYTAYGFSRRLPLKIALISDTHDDLERLAQALAIFAQTSAQALIHAGDIASPVTAQKLSTFDGPIHAVFGNVDNNRQALGRILKSIAPAPVTFELDGWSFVLAHDRTYIPDELLGQADVAVVGHTHQAEHSHDNHTLIINPGTCRGGSGEPPTVALLDSQNLSVEIITLP